ncbi:cellulase family glycosylhydrolase [Actinoplanes sp. N902-109]|uniref:cellulase family glycosylhydrolase n=1 Tax=Actinoplanes sp. (strain N902-109) TaxID=649831 RepID=UPI0003293838|nr:cellulase family glycosylhydrolase [Actinoplanes sp. N902-109]AGL17173.1 endoglucanase CelA [Actinoplanes sp. N902-109]
MRKTKLKLLIAGAVAAAASAVALIAIPASAQTAAFTVTNSWSTGYQASVVVKNDTSNTLPTWKVEVTLPAGSAVVNSWNAIQAGSGSSYTFTPAGWNATVAAGASVEFGMIVSGTGRPTSCTVNGSDCGVATSPTTVPASTAPATTTPTSKPATTAPTTKPATTAPTTAPATTAPTTAAPATGTPVGINGQLHVCGVNLCNQYDKAIQLRGMSTHGLQWFPDCYTNASLDALANDWNADLLRIAMYVQEGGYETDPSGFTGKVNTLVDMAEARGMYALVDFHTLTPGDPNVNLDRARTFFAAVAKRNAAKKNVIYEIANEPNGVSWTAVKSYAEQVIPVIRANDPDAVVIVGTRGWSSLGVSDGSNSSEVIANPVKASNIMYTFHFYAASHKDNYRAEVQKAAASLPLFVTEFGTVSASGGGAVDTAGSTAWLDLLDKLRISYANWTFSDANEGSAALKPGTCASGSFTGTGALTESGALIRSRIRTADNFPVG